MNKMDPIPKEVGIVTVEAKDAERIVRTLWSCGYIVMETSSSNRATKHFYIAVIRDGEGDDE